MGSQGHDQGFSVFPETIVLASGATMALPPVPGQNAVRIRYGAGGSLILFAGASLSLGSTFATAGVYVFGATEIADITCSGTLYFGAPGVTTTFYLARTLSLTTSDYT